MGPPGPDIYGHEDHYVSHDWAAAILAVVGILVILGLTILVYVSTHDWQLP